MADDRTRTSLTEPGTVMGTVNYMSPEQATGRAAGPASDIFSLGAVLYEMLAGRRPFERETAPETMTAILREDPPEIARPGISPATRTSSNNIPKKIRLFDLETDTARQLPPDRPAMSGLAWSASGHELMFAWSDDLLSGQASTAARMVLQDVRTRETRDLFWASDMLNVQRGTQIDIVGPGTVVFGSLALAQNLTQVVSTGDAPAESRTLTSGTSVDRQPCLGPDGETVLFASNRTGSLDLWTLNRRTGAERPPTDDGARREP